MNWRELLHQDIRRIVRDDPTSPSAHRSRSWTPHYFRRGKYWADLLTVTRILEGFVHANVPLVGGLRAAAQDAPRYPLWRVMTGHEKDLAGGTSLSDSIRNNSGFFPGFYADLVRAGEDSGTLAQSFATLHEIIQQVVQQRTRVWQYKTYIGVVWLFLIAVFLFLGLKVTPVLVDTVRELSAGAPRISLIMEGVVQGTVEATAFCVTHGWGFLSGLVLLVIGAVYWKRKRRQRIAANFINVFAEGIVLYTPVFGRMLQKRTLAHIAQVLEKLLAAGMPLDEALDAAAGLDVHPRFADALRRVRGRVSGGSTLKDAFDAEPCFPESFRGFVSLGESSGLLPEALARVSSLYRRQILKMERILLDVLSPIGIVAAGVGVLALFESHMRTIAGICASLVEQLMRPANNIAKLRPRSLKGRRCGSVLIELITALAVLTVGLLGAVHLYYRGLDALRTVREASLVATAIRNEVETLRATPFASLQSGTNVSLDGKASGLEQLVNLRMNVRIEDAFDTNLRVKWISVDVSWSGENGRTIRQNATTLVADKGAS